MFAVWSIVVSRAQRRAQLDLFRSACDRDDARAGGDTELDRGGTHCARAADHEQVLAGLQHRSSVQGEMTDVERQCERGRFDVVETGWCVEHCRARRERMFGHTTERLIRHGDHPPADPLFGTVSGRVDHAAHVHPERERRLRHDARHAAASAGDVAEVHRRRGHRDAHAAGFGIGNVDVEDLDHLGRTTVADHPDCLHFSPVSPVRRSALVSIATRTP